MATFRRTAQITPDDHGPLVNLAAWMLMVTAILFTAFRLVSNVFLRGRFRTHDWIIIFATACAIGQSIATSMMVTHGLGQHQDTLSAATIISYAKSSLAAAVLYIVTLTANKLSLFVFLNEMLAASQTKFHKFMYTVWVVLVCYTIAATFSLSFACGLPKPYNLISGQCINFLGFWNFHAALDIIVSFTVFLLPSIIVFPLHMDPSLKAHVIFPFALELPLCAFAVVRIINVHKAFNAEDHTWADVDAQIWTQISMHLGVVAANIPCLKIFLKGFQSVLFRTDTTRLQSNAGSWGNSKERSRKESKRSARHASANMFRRTDGESITQITSSYTAEPAEDTGSTLKNTQESRIHKTTGWTVLESKREGS